MLTQWPSWLLSLLQNQLFIFDEMNVYNRNHRKISANRLIGKVPSIAAWSYLYNLGRPFNYPRNDLSYAANFLNMLFSSPTQEYEINPVLVRAFERILILHADHDKMLLPQLLD